GDDLVDHLAAGSDDFADLLGVDGEAHDLGRVGAQVIPGLAQGLQHDAQDVQTALQRLRQSGLENVAVNARDLDVHLNGGDAVHGARHLEVHVAQEVFQALDVGEHNHLAGFRVLNQAHGHAGHGGVNRHARIHQGQGGAAHGG